jgi:hypothetical protein
MGPIKPNRGKDRKYLIRMMLNPVMFDVHVSAESSCEKVYHDIMRHHLHSLSQSTPSCKVSPCTSPISPYLSLPTVRTHPRVIAEMPILPPLSFNMPIITFRFLTFSKRFARYNHDCPLRGRRAIHSSSPSHEKHWPRNGNSFHQPNEYFGVGMYDHVNN